MPSCIFDTCCGCINLRTGCLIIGYLNLIGNIILVGACGFLLGGSAVIASAGEKQETREVGGVLVVVTVILMIVALFSFAMAIVLLVGIHQNRRGHVKAYLIVGTICLVLMFIATLSQLAGHITAQDVISKLLSLALSIYFMMVIRSHYYKMDEDKRPAIYSAA